MPSPRFAALHQSATAYSHCVPPPQFQSKTGNSPERASATFNQLPLSSHLHSMSPTSATAASPPQKKGSSVSTAPPPSLSWLEALPVGTHEVIGSFLDAADVCRLSLASRWCLETLVEEGVSVVTLNTGRHVDALEGPVAMFLAAYLRRRRRLKCVRVSLSLDCHTVVPLALAFAAGSCRQVETLRWDLGENPRPADMDIMVSALALNSLPDLKTLNMGEPNYVQSFVSWLATGASPLLENLRIYVGEDEEVPRVLEALIRRSHHEACVPLRHLRFFQYVEERDLMKEFFACRLLANVEELIMGGHGRSWMDAFVVYLEEGLAQGKPRGVKRVQAGFSYDYPSGDAEMLMDVLARGGAPDLEVLDGFVEEKDGFDNAVIWTSHAKWLLETSVMGKRGACPKLLLSTTLWRSSLCLAD